MANGTNGEYGNNWSILRKASDLLSNNGPFYTTFLCPFWNHLVPSYQWKFEKPIILYTISIHFPFCANYFPFCCTCHYYGLKTVQSGKIEINWYTGTNWGNGLNLRALRKVIDGFVELLQLLMFRHSWTVCLLSKPFPLRCFMVPFLKLDISK